MENEPINFGGAVILCAHVAKSQFPILLGERDESTMPEDTGWQFLCNRVESEDMQEAQVWGLNEVLDVVPSLARFVNCPVGTTIMRDDEKSEWKIVKGGDCQTS